MASCAWYPKRFLVPSRRDRQRASSPCGREGEPAPASLVLVGRDSTLDSGLLQRGDLPLALQQRVLECALKEVAEGVVTGPPIHRRDKAEQIPGRCQPAGVWPQLVHLQVCGAMRIKGELGRAALCCGKWGLNLEMSLAGTCRQQLREA